MLKLFGILFCFFIASAVSKELSSHIPICQRNPATIGQCLMMATVTLQPYIAKGIKDLNIPALEPLEIPMIKLEQGTGAVSYRATLTKIKVYGLSHYVFKEFDAVFGQNGIKLNGNLDLPKISLTANYDIDGKVLLLPIKGNGDFNANITNCKATFVNNGGITKKKGVEYLQSKDTKLRLEIGDAMVHFDNLFNGDPVLSKTTNDFFNQNSKDIINEIKPAIEAVVSMLIDDIVNKAFRSNPYDKLFPK